ncbi:MAG TPA: dihydropyrimidinase [Patescibacteria group bacterium]|nr:dihydropyrimidinase [Patescibacteria group bacterium]
MLDLAIVGATVVTPSTVALADIGVAAGKIASIARPGALGPAARVVDARGMIVIPGAVDPHTHLDAEMFSMRTADDFESGTVAAAAGGVTTIVDYAFQERGGSLADAIEKWRGKADGRAIIDYGFHVALLDPSPEAIAEIPRVASSGVTSIKIFMMQGFEARARDFLRAFKVASESGALLTIHAEDECLIGFCTERLLAAGKRDVTHFAASRPPLSEAAAVRRALAMTELCAAPAYFVHLSSRDAIDEIRRARARGRTVLAETRPIYLYLTEERFLEPNGAKYIGYPPLRSAEDRDAIWTALSDGTIDVVATDHCSWTLERKLAPDRFTRMPPGMSNLETLVPMLYSEGVAKGRISLSRWVDLIATNPARIFGMYPRKGAIVEGADADLVIFDPARKVVIDSRQMHSRADYDPFEGFEVTGWPKMTISRGVPIAIDRKVDASPGRGEFIAREPFSPVWRSR